MRGDRKRELTRNAGLFCLLIGLVLTIALVVDSAAERHYQNQERFKNKRLKELMLYKSLLEKGEFGNSFTIDEEPWYPKPDNGPMFW